MGIVEDKIRDLKARQAKMLEMGARKPLPPSVKKEN